MFLKKNQSTPRPSEHVFKEKSVILSNLDLLSIPQSGGKNVKTFRWDHRLQRQDFFMAFKRGSPMVVLALGPQYNIGEKPTVMLYTYLHY